MISESDFRAAMTKRGLTTENVDTMLGWLRADSLVTTTMNAAADRGGLVQLRTLSAAAAQSSDHARLAKWVHGACARLGFDLDPNKVIDDSTLFRMNQAFAGKDFAFEERIAIKSALHKLGCIN